MTAGWETKAFREKHSIGKEHYSNDRNRRSYTVLGIVMTETDDFLWREDDRK